MPFTIGLDFGTNSVRAIVVNCRNGSEIGGSSFLYPSGNNGVLLDTTRDELARQHPGDYLIGLERAVRGALGEAVKTDRAFSAEGVIGIGVAGTGSSPLPVDEKNRPLAMQKRFRENLAAQCWLWKDHTSTEEAAAITDLVNEQYPHYLRRCGGVYSSEWWWAKLWRCLNEEPEVFFTACSWVELADWIPSVLAGVDDPTHIRRSAGCAGHKAMFDRDWGGLPERDFFTSLSPDLVPLRDRLFPRVFNASDSAGSLSPSWAVRLGIPAGIPVSIGGIDVYYGAIGAGVKEGVLVKIIGTSACDCTVFSSERTLGAIPGICGMVRGSVLPNAWGIEAGQCAVGDIFAWWTNIICEGDRTIHDRLTREAAELEPGESGLLALDWHNGNRNILIDSRLTGLMIGQSLQTSKAEIYRSLIEATAFGARMIRDRLVESGIVIDEIICVGGITGKNFLLMQIFSDVLECRLRISRSDQACALGAAVVAAVVAGSDRGGYASFDKAQERMTGVTKTTYVPNIRDAAVYRELFGAYGKIHDAFGGVHQSDLGSVMKRLLEIKNSVREKRRHGSSLRRGTGSHEEPLRG